MKEKTRKNSRKKISTRTAAAVSALLFAFCSVNWTPVNAMGTEDIPSDETYYLADYGSDTVLNGYSTFKIADRSFEALKDQYDNLTIVKDAKVYKAEYAIAVIASTDACDYNVLFSNDLNGQSNYTNGCYGKDAAYLDTDDSGTEAEFYLSGVKGWADIADIEIVPVQNIPSRLSGYAIDSGNLFHHIKSSMDEDNYASILNVGTAPNYMNEDVNYYSYDGHYFYTEDSLAAMLDDLRNDVRSASVNPDDPYYNYYQYVSNRTLTNATCVQVEELFNDTLGIDAWMDTYNDDNKDSADDTLNCSQFYDTAEVFYQNQYQYGANAMMMIALSANESAFGRSSLSFTRNNLFGHAAYDNDVEKNASRYLSIANSIYSHAKYYISGSYCYPGKTSYHGGFFGNKSAGMNVSYASDPYWGEKAAYYYRLLDEMLGYADRDAYTVGIKTSNDNVSVYQYPDETSTVLYQTSEMPDYAFVILREFSDDTGDWYAIQSDATLNDQSEVALEYTYDFENDIGYIRRDAVQVILNPDSQNDVSYINVTFDADGGTFSNGESTVSYKLPTGSDAAAGIPEKDHALFTGWDAELTALSEDTVFKAQYSETESIAIETMPETEYETNDRINLKDGTIRIEFADGKSSVTALTTSMVSGFDLSIDGEQTVTVSYAGCTAEYAITVSAQKDAERTEIKTAIVDMIEQYKDAETLSDEDIVSILALKTRIDEQVQPYLNQSQLRSFDSILRKAYQEKIRYIVKDSSVNLEVSGLSLSLPLGDSLDKNQMFPDTYRVSFSNGVSGKAKKLLGMICEGQNDETDIYFRISVTKNGEKVISDRPLLYSIDIPAESAEDAYFTVYSYDSEDGDVTECYTLQSDTKISFMAYGTGEYLLAYRRTSNSYTGTDPLETVTSANSSDDIQRTIATAVIASVLAAAAVLILVYCKRRKTKNEIKKRQLERFEKEKTEDTEAENDQHNSKD